MPTSAFTTYLYWHERWRCSRLPFRRLTDNDISGPLFLRFFLDFAFEVAGTIGRGSEEERPGIEEEAEAEAEGGAIPGM